MVPINQNEDFLNNDKILSNKYGTLHFLVNNLPHEATTISIAKNEDMFKWHPTFKDPIYVTHGDVDEFLRLGWLNI